MLDFLARILRSTTPADSPDWLGQHNNAERVWQEPTKDGQSITYEDRSGALAVYNTDDLGNVNHIDVYEAGQ